jgi:hypothetical protein
MRRLLAVLLIVATPAWAFNEEPTTRPTTQEEWVAAQQLCQRLGGNNDVCAMGNAHSEMVALATAKAALDLCDKDAARAGCDVTRAYIKRRWGTDAQRDPGGTDCRGSNRRTSNR